jgi:hypothetical protein
MIFNVKQRKASGTKLKDFHEFCPDDGMFFPTLWKDRQPLEPETRVAGDTVILR